MKCFLGTPSARSLHGSELLETGVDSACGALLAETPRPLGRAALQGPQHPARAVCSPCPPVTQLFAKETEQGKGAPLLQGLAVGPWRACRVVVSGGPSLRLTEVLLQISSQTLTTISQPLLSAPARRTCTAEMLCCSLACFLFIFPGVGLSSGWR